VTINWLSRALNRRVSSTEETPPEEEDSFLGSMSAIVDLVELEHGNLVKGVVLDYEGRQYEFRATTKGRLLHLSGNREELSRVWPLAEKFLLQYYVGDTPSRLSEIDKSQLLKEFRDIQDRALQRLSHQIESLESKYLEGDTYRPEPVASPVHSRDVVDFEPTHEQMLEVEEENKIDFSDDDLAQRALQVLNGEIEVEV